MNSPQGTKDKLGNQGGHSEDAEALIQSETDTEAIVTTESDAAISITERQALEVSGLYASTMLIRNESIMCDGSVNGDFPNADAHSAAAPLIRPMIETGMALTEADISDSDSSLSEELFREFECFSDDEIDIIIDEGDDKDMRGVSLSSKKVSMQVSLGGGLYKSFKRSTTSKSTAARTRYKLKQADQPVKGIIFFIIYCFLKTLSYVVVQMLYNRNPDLKPFPLLFIRSAWGIAIMMTTINVRLKKDTYDTVSKDQVGSLIFKTFTGTTTNMINYSVTKYIPLTIISIVANLAPIIVVVFAFLILKETIRRFDLAMMLLTLVGIFAVIFGGNDTTPDSEEDEQPALPYLVLYILLLINPFLSAGGTIAMRKMKKFHECVVSWYMQWSILISSAIIMWICGLSFTIYGTFDWQSWVLAFLAGATSVYSETMRFKALKLQKASAVQKLIPLTTLFQFVFDVLLFKISYSYVQDGALGYLMLLYVFQGLKYLLYDSKKKDEKKEEQRQRLKSIASQGGLGSSPNARTTSNNTLFNQGLSSRTPQPNGESTVETNDQIRVKMNAIRAHSMQ